MSKDSKEAFKLFVFLSIILVIFASVVIYFVAKYAPGFIDFLNLGLGIREASIYAFGFTMVSFIILLVFSGDGVLGEFLVTILSFLVYYIISWIWIAAIF